MSVTYKTDAKEPSDKGKPKPKSGVAYPYYDLGQSVAVAKAIHEKGGGACSREQLAPLIGYSGIKNGGFLTRISAAKMFGLIEENGSMLRLTERAKKIISPVVPAEADKAYVDAFLGVELFGKVYEQFKGQSLPAETGLKNLLQNTFTIVPDRVAPALRVMLESAEIAGFFKASGNRSQMILPLAANHKSHAINEMQQQIDNSQVDSNNNQEKKDNSGSKTEYVGTIPAALIGLLERLPPVGTVIPPKRRAALSDAFKSAIDFLYPEDED